MDFKYQVICDSREKENSHIIRQLEKNNIKWVKKKLDVGDYAIELIPEAPGGKFSVTAPGTMVFNTNNPADVGYPFKVVRPLIIERKANLSELVGNLLEKRDSNNMNRFERELKNATDMGYRIILLIEEPDFYNKLMRKQYRSRCSVASIRGMLFALQSRYNVSIMSVSKEQSASIIWSLLFYDLREKLKGI